MTVPASRSRTTRGTGHAAAAIVALAVLAAACGKGTADPSPARTARPVPVSVATAEARDVPMRLRAVGTAEPVSDVTIRPQVGGLLAGAAFDEGADVRKGDLLFRIDDRPFAAALRQAEAALARDEALAAAAARDAARYEALAQQQYASREDRDRLAAQADSTRAQVAVDRAAVEQARLNLSYATIRSPIDGRAGPLLAKPGNVVQAGSTALVTLNQVDPIRVAFPVPEARLPEVRRQMSRGDVAVEALPQGDAGDPVRGRLTFVDNAVDRATGTVLLKASFANADHRLWPGQFVRVTATLGTRAGAVAVPSAAVQDGQSGPYLFAVGADGTADLRKVATGPADDGFTVIESGVEAGERVIVDGQVRVSPGAAVEIRQ